MKVGSDLILIFSPNVLSIEIQMYSPPLLNLCPLTQKQKCSLDPQTMGPQILPQRILR